MKKEVAVAQIKPGVSLIDENLLKSRIYTIRGVKVMLDADLAEIYGYETRFFNRQVKNNIERFAEDFRFQLTEDEMQNLMCKNCTSSWGGTRKRPFAFTEQGIYMLMTVLRGELAVRQSRALVMAFKSMKDHIVAGRSIAGSHEMLQDASSNIKTQTFFLKVEIFPALFSYIRAKGQT